MKLLSTTPKTIATQSAAPQTQSDNWIGSCSFMADVHGCGDFLPRNVSMSTVPQKVGRGICVQLTMCIGGTTTCQKLGSLSRNCYWFEDVEFA